MDNWSLLGEVAHLIDISGLPTLPSSKWRTLRHVAAGTAQVVLSPNRSVAVLPQKLDLSGPILLRQNPGVYEVLVRSLINKRPAFVLHGSLDGLLRLCGLDDQSELPVRITAAGLILAFGRVNGAPAAVHIALTEDRMPSIRQLCAGTTIGTNSLPQFAPVILVQNEYRMATKWVPGDSLMPWGKSEQALQGAIFAALRPLKSIRSNRSLTNSPDDDFVGLLARFVQGHKRQHDLNLGLAILENWDRSAIGSVTVHGDYWLNNILASGGAISGVLDWDRARLNGCAALDALHLGFMSYAMWADTYVSELLSSIWTGRWRYAWLGNYIRLVSDMFDVTLSDVKHIATLLWLSYFYYGDNNAPRSEWNTRMIEPVCRALSSARSAPVLNGVSL